MLHSPTACGTESRFSPWFRCVTLLFVLSGSGGLLAQVCYSKYLVTVVGATAYATSAVLAAFMTGLALGATLGGRLSHRLSRPLVAYGLAELVVAGALAAGPFAFHALTPAYAAIALAIPDSAVWLNVVRWLVALAIVLVPTTAMGATLPILAGGLGSPIHRESRLGALYAANTLGGGFGALIGAYAVIPALGLTRSLLASALCSAIAGCVAIWLGRRLPRSESAETRRSEGSSPRQGATAGNPTSAPPTHRFRALTALALLSGWIVFACEVLFTHLLAVVIGNSAYAFALILAIFLGCLFVGASLAPSMHRRWPDAALSLGLIAAGLATLATLPLWDSLPLVFANMGDSVTSFAGRELFRGGVALVILVVPTTLMGLTFPLLLQQVAREKAPGTLVGQLTAINTIGAVLGALGTGYVMLPMLGSEHSLLILALVLVSTGLITSHRSYGKHRRPLAIAVAVFAAGLCALPGWDPARITAGTNVYFDEPRVAEKLLFWREDVHGGITTVTINDENVRTLYTNGKFQGNTGWEIHAQRLFAHYPSLFVESFNHALVIGLGTGTTLGTLEAYPWKRLEIVDISPSIVDAARTHFGDVNRHALSDRRAFVHLDDGRNHLLLDRNRYDLISMELSSIWFAGAASLYNREFYASVSAHLQPRGVFQQWVQLHHILPKDFASIMETLLSEFKSVLLFYGGGQGIVVAANHHLSTRAAHLEALERLPSLKSVRPQGRTFDDLLDDVLLTRTGLESWLSMVAKREGYQRRDAIATDDNSYLEYATPRGNVLPWQTREALVAELVQYRDWDALMALRAPRAP